ncbi:class I SAM-dependent methyltransferase [Clostridium sp. Marseille-Q7071]
MHLFGKIGPDYWNQFGNRLVELSSINKDAKVLDIGMGRGASLFATISKIGEDGHAIGIDISEVMVSETYKDILKQHIENAEVIKMNAENLDFDNNSFDNVICGFGIGYLLFSDNKLNDVLRVLKKDGQVGFSIWGVQEDQKWLTEIVNKYLNIDSSNENSNKKSNIPQFNTLDGAKKVLEDSGFRNVKTYQKDADVVYKSKEEWWQEMWSNVVRTIFERVEELGENKFKEFKIDIFNGLEKFRKIDGFHFNMPVIYAFGEK